MLHYLLTKYSIEYHSPTFILEPNRYSIITHSTPILSNLISLEIGKIGSSIGSHSKTT